MCVSLCQEPEDKYGEWGVWERRGRTGYGMVRRTGSCIVFNIMP